MLLQQNMCCSKETEKILLYCCCIVILIFGILTILGQEIVDYIIGGLVCAVAMLGCFGANSNNRLHLKIFKIIMVLMFLLIGINMILKWQNVGSYDTSRVAPVLSGDSFYAVNIALDAFFLIAAYLAHSLEMKADSN
eukprot:g18524.t1